MDLVTTRAYAAGLIAAGIGRVPEPVLARLAGPVPDVARGLAPEAWLLARLADRVATGAPPPLEVSRRYGDAETRFASRTADVPVRESEEGGRRVRWYEPPDAIDGLLVFFHGGGWAQRSIESHDRSVRFLADLAGVRVASVDYRLAPEHPFPAAADDALVAYLSICRRLGDERVAVGGDSAGANLAASVAITARDRGERVPDFQWLLYPCTDAAFKRPSVKDFSTGFFLTEAAMDRYNDMYLPTRELKLDPRASPIYADPTGLPPAYVATALADPLRDEGEAYAAMLEHGTVQRFGHLHGFFNMTALPRAREAVSVAAGALRAGLA
jgi:acetyl esterase